MINTQQIIVMMPLFAVQLPPNAAIFFGFLANLTAFDLIPTQVFYDIYFPPPVTDGPLNDNFNALGFSSMYFLYNLGSMILGLLSLPLIMAFSLILRLFKRKNKLLNKIYKKLTGIVFWEHPITLTNETFWLICFCTFINVTFVSIISSFKYLDFV